MTPKSVVENVQTIDNATSPPANNVNKFDACPPLTEPSRIIPAASLLLKPNNFDNISATNGITPKQYKILVDNTDACFRAYDRS